MATAYRPKAGLSPRAAGATAGLGAVAGLVGGAAAHLAARALYAAFLVPVAWGLAVGFTVAAACRRFRVARPAFAGAVAAAAVALAAATQIGLDYRLDRHERAALAAEVYEAGSMATGPTEIAEETYQAKLDELTFGRYLERRYGTDPELAPAGGLASSLGPRGTIAVSALELALGGGIAIVLARRRALEPACPRCGAWRVKAPLGEAAHGVAAQIAERLERGESEAAAALVEPPDTREAVVLSRLACPSGHDGEGGVLRIEDREIDSRRRPRTHICAELEASGDEMRAVAAAVAEGAGAGTTASAGPRARGDEARP